MIFSTTENRIDSLQGIAREQEHGLCIMLKIGSMP